MAAKKSPPSRLGNDPFGWIRDTRDEEENEMIHGAGETAPTPPPEVKKTAPKAVVAEAIQNKAVEAPTPSEPKPLPTPVQHEAQQVEREAVAERNIGEVVDTMQEAAETADAVSQAKAVLSPQEIAALAAILQEAKGPAKRGRPRTNFREVTKSSQEGLPENWTRATFIVRESHLDRLKDYAYTQRSTIRDVLDQALDQFLADKEVIERNPR